MNLESAFVTLPEKLRAQLGSQQSIRNRPKRAPKLRGIVERGSETKRQSAALKFKCGFDPSGSDAETVWLRRGVQRAVQARAHGESDR
jgi:hypothetical protein